MRAGKLRHLVTAQHEVRTPDGAGGHAFVWTTVGSAFWADISTTSGREFQAAKATAPTLTHLLEVRYRTDITPDMRLVTDDGAVLEITAVMDPDGRHRRTLIHCEALVGETV